MAAQAVLAPAQVVSKCQLQCHNISLSLAHHITKARNTAGPETHKPHYNSQMISRILVTRLQHVKSQKRASIWNYIKHIITIINT